MKARRFVFCLLILSAFLFITAHPLTAQEAKDVVLVVDTSASMFAYYNEVNTYLTGPFLAENLRSGDTLHIISYGSRPRFEIARRVSGQGDIETVSGRIWLLYPLEVNSDPGGALSYAEQYARSIPGGRAKKVFVVSDDDNTESLSSAAADRLRPTGTELFFIRASRNIRSPGGSPAASSQAARQPASPAAGSPPSSTPPAATAQSTTPAGTGTGAGTGTAGTGANTGTGAAAGTAAGTSNAAGTAAGTGAAAAGTDGAAAGTGTAAGTAGTGGVSDDAASGTTAEETAGITGTNPESAENSGQTAGTGTELSGGTATDGRESALAAGQSTDLSGAAASQPFTLSSVPLPVWLGLLLLLLILLIIFLVTRRLHDSPNKAVASSTDNSASKNADLLNSFASRQAAAALQGTPRRSQYRDPGSFPTNPPMLNLFVEEQNTAIGRRNVHALKRGSTYTVGGGSSDFLIFLVPVPSRLGQLYFDGNNCTFTPLKPKYFPDIGSNQVHECIGKTIRLLSDKNYEVFFHFERYKDPLIALNQLLHSIEVPVPPEDRK